MKILLYVIYTLNTSNIQFKTYDFTERGMQECRVMAQRMVDQAKVGKTRAFCDKVKEV